MTQPEAFLSEELERVLHLNSPVTVKDIALPDGRFKVAAAMFPADDKSRFHEALGMTFSAGAILTVERHVQERQVNPPETPHHCRPDSCVCVEFTPACSVAAAERREVAPATEEYGLAIGRLCLYRLATVDPTIDLLGQETDPGVLLIAHELSQESRQESSVAPAALFIHNALNAALAVRKPQL